MHRIQPVIDGLTLCGAVMALLALGAYAARAEDAGRPAGGAAAAPGKLVPVDKALLPDLFVWTDTCNVYVLRDGEAALLIDLGDGSVLDHLTEIGVKRVEWVLFTHHHREQCQGYPRLQGSGAKVAGPEAERALFERPASFRKMKVRLGDAFTVHGASYVRPPIQPIPLDRGFAAMDEFTWRGRTVRCLQTRGNSPGGMSYFLQREGRWMAFSGDVMLDGARLHNWFDTEWDYGFAAGIYALAEAASLVESFDPVLLLPSHGPAVSRPKPQLREVQDKLRRLERLLVRGYPVNTFGAADQDRVSKPTTIPNIWQVTPHLYKFKGPNLGPNFAILIADSGRGLVVDCGLVDAAVLDKALESMRECLGLKGIDAMIITHMHGDHFLQAPQLRDKYGAKVWTLDRIADLCERPERYDYAAPIQAYGAGVDSVRIDRAFKSGETFEWEGYRFTVDWMPGQTEFALCLYATIDGRKVAFTGDHLFGDPADPGQTGHEAVVAHNSGILEEGYMLGTDYLAKLKPDLIVAGHSFVLDAPAGMIDRFQKWSRDMRAAFQALSADVDYRYGFDPYWVRAEPYRVTVKRGQFSEVLVRVRNFRDREQTHRIELHAPAGLQAEPAVLEGKVGPASREAFPVRIKAAEGAPAGVKIVAFDITLDGKRYGEWFDFIVDVE
ncbi:MAG: MBL fold metallo-hydrolase [Planctomycetes bacterium]|nr:MBL fold metallo-hydrolase [Planctomycetota bacterium]